jgi:hypothetical protein
MKSYFNTTEGGGINNETLHSLNLGTIASTEATQTYYITTNGTYSSNPSSQQGYYRVVNGLMSGVGGYTRRDPIPSNYTYSSMSVTFCDDIVNKMREHPEYLYKLYNNSGTLVGFYDVGTSQGAIMSDHNWTEAVNVVGGYIPSSGPKVYFNNNGVTKLADKVYVNINNQTTKLF